MPTDHTFRCCVEEDDLLELIPQTNGDVTVTVYEGKYTSSMVSIARSDIPKLISSLQIIYERGEN